MGRAIKLAYQLRLSQIFAAIEEVVMVVDEVTSPFHAVPLGGSRNLVHYVIALRYRMGRAIKLAYQLRLSQIFPTIDEVVMVVDEVTSPFHAAPLGRPRSLVHYVIALRFRMGRAIKLAYQLRLSQIFAAIDEVVMVVDEVTSPFMRFRSAGLVASSTTLSLCDFGWRRAIKLAYQLRLSQIFAAIDEVVMVVDEVTSPFHAAPLGGPRSLVHYVIALRYWMEAGN